ncbi:hypothetical protein H696_02444 [Fonticula alba]|uniref:Sodium/bile acid cotransporter 7 n=1 Tax=Fonticula alba TaxID=691883 RepID=A0A058ZAQ6_FONAL|nr:hypothetical protein H696_02444 [Fonticula alba]KCV71500.1 hypothetical protein H696_02444 [Fonticula alba]|eukprot:XP_009494623.1 hypothetical protein H696_02444 [Fonticula alba]
MSADPLDPTLDRNPFGAHRIQAVPLARSQADGSLPDLPAVSFVDPAAVGDSRLHTTAESSPASAFGVGGLSPISLKPEHPPSGLKMEDDMDALADARAGHYEDHDAILRDSDDEDGEGDESPDTSPATPGPLGACWAGFTGSLSSAWNTVFQALPPWGQRFVTGALKIADQQSFAIMMVVVALAAYVAPSIGKKGGPLLPEYTVSYGSMMIIFFLTGLDLNSGALVRSLSNIKLQASMMGLTFVVLPLVGWVFVEALLKPMGGFFPQDIIVGFLVLVSLPSTVSSNSILTDAAAGDTAAAVTASVISNTFGVVLSPLIVLLMIQTSSSVGILGVYLKLGLTVILPLLVGQVCQRPWAAGWVGPLRRWVPFGTVRQAMVLLFLYCTFCDTFAAPESPLSAPVFWAVLGLVMLLYTILCIVCWVLVAVPPLRFTRPERVAAFMVASQKTMVVGMPMISSMYADSPDFNVGVVALPVLLFHPLQLLICGFLVPTMKLWVERDAARNSAAGADSTSAAGQLDNDEHLIDASDPNAIPLQTLEHGGAGHSVAIQMSDFALDYLEEDTSDDLLHI